MTTATMSPVITASVNATAAKLKGVINFQESERGLIAKRTELLILEVSLAAKLHPLFYGPPGTAKSMSVDGLLMHVPDLSKFKTQAYKASPPEQFLGPISFKGMAEDRFVRITTRRLADSEVVFVDEISRAPRAVLPAFQGAMVEREFDAGDGVVKIPLQTFIGTANHIQDDPELEAFFDRWAFKLIVRPVASQDQFIAVMEGALKRHEFGEPAIPPELLISRAELSELQDAVTRAHVDRSILERMAELWANVLGIGVVPSIRRYTDLIKGMRAMAVLDGRDEVTVDDLQIAMHSLWNAPDEAAAVYGEVVKFASEWVKKRAELLDSFTETLDRLNQVQSMVAGGADTSAQVEIEDETKSLTDHGIRVVNAQRKLSKLIQTHIADATGQDTSELAAVLTQIDGARDWVSDRLLGGLTL